MASVCKVRCKDKFLKRQVDPMLLTTPDDFNSQSSSFEGVEDVLDPASFFRQHGAQFSVYSVDFDRRVLVLVRVRSGFNIRRAAFFFQAQRENAEELLLIPFDALPAVAYAVQFDVAAVRNVFLHNTGRCGSTLLCKAMEATKDVHAVSEPDIYTWIFAYAQAHDFQLTPAEEEDIIMVLRCSTTLLNFYFLQNDPSRAVICYKLRGFAVFIAELLQRAVPGSKTVFLYRDLPGFFNSWISVLYSGSYWKYFVMTALRIDGFFTAQNMMHMITYFKTSYVDDPRLAKYDGTRGTPFFFVSTWLLRMQKAFDLIQADSSNFFNACLRYNELAANKEQIILKVMKQLGIDIHSEDYSKIRKVFDAESQEGSNMQSVRRKGGQSGRSWVGHWETSLFSTVIKHFQGDIDCPEFILPNTIMV